MVLTGENQGDKKVAHVYAGRGIKQTTYPTNYANASFFLFGDLRLLAYPELFEQPGVMAFLGGLTYALIPKDGNPSIAEVMDGSFSRKLDEATSSGGSVAGTFKKTYDLEFPLTILLVNGGPECNGNKNIPAANIPLNNNNTKIRLEAYNYFVATSDLLAPVKVGALPAEAPAFNAKAGDATGIEPEEYAATDANGKPNGAHYLPKSEDPLSPPNDNYNLTGNLDSCLKLMVGAINAKPPAKDYAGFVADPATKKMTPQEFTDAKLTERAASPDWQAAIYNGDYVVVGGDVWQSNDNKPASVGKFTKISFTPWTSLFDRAIYYGPNWNKTACVVTGSADGMPIFGGAPVKKLIDDANFAKK